MYELLSLVTPVAHASVDTFVKKLNTYLINPIIALLFALATAYFIYGIFEYINNLDNESEREKGKQHMIWSLIGMFIMVGVFFILRVLLGTIGINEQQINVETGQVNIGGSSNQNPAGQ